MVDSIESTRSASLDPSASSGVGKVTLRPARPLDAHLLQTWRSEPGVRLFQPITELTVGQLRDDLAHQRMAELYRSRGEKFQWIVLAEGEPAGWLTLVVSNWEHGLGEVGYALSEDFQRRGVMAQALRQLLTELFHRTRLERIEARCAVGNQGSRKVLERVGFQFEGRLRSYFRLRGRRVDNFLFAILPEDLRRADR